MKTAHRKESGMKNSISAGLILAAVFGIMAMPFAAELDGLLEKMPAQTVREGEYAAVEILRGGQDAVAALCGRLAPPGTGDDTAARFAVNLLAKYVSAGGREIERLIFAHGVETALAAMETDNEVKAFLLKQLELTGGPETVRVMGQYLTDARLHDPAVRVLTNIASPDAVALLERALTLTEGTQHARLLKALGDLQVADPVLTYIEDAASSDVSIRDAARYALAMSGAPEARPVLKEAVRNTSGLERKNCLALYMEYAKRCGETGHGKIGIEICRELLAAENAPAHLAGAALYTLAAYEGKKVMPDLMDAVRSDKPALRGQAILLADRIPGKNATQDWMKAAKKADSETKAAILRMLGLRGDNEAAGLLCKALRDDNEAVRAAAIESVAYYPSKKTLKHLMKALKRAEAPDRPRIRAAILRLPGREAGDECAERLPKADNEEQKELLRILAARRAERHKETVFEAAAAEDTAIRVEALQALAVLTGGDDMPRLVNLLENAAEDREYKAAVQALAAAAEKVAPSAKKAEAVIAALKDAEETDYRWLLETLKRIGGEEALDAAVSETGGKRGGVAAGVLAQWRSTDAIMPLLNIYLAPPSGETRTIVLEGILRLAADQSMQPEDRVWIYDECLKATVDASEKRQILEQLAQVRTAGALQTAGVYLDDPEVAADAAGHIIAMACPADEKDKGLEGWHALTLLRKAAAVTTDEGLRQKAAAYIARLEARKPAPPPARDETGFVPLFNGRDLTGWTGGTRDYRAEFGRLVCLETSRMNLFHKEEFSDFVLRFEFKLTPGANNGLGIRTPMMSHAAYDGMELQILDNTAEKFKGIKPYQAHGSIYGVVPAKTGHLKPAGEWNYQEVVADGSRITVRLNGAVIVDAGLDTITETPDGKEHPGLHNKSGHIAFLGHGSRVEFRNIRIRKR
jgi:HEAT repeat protein